VANVVILGGSEEARLILRGLLRLHQHRVHGESASPPEALELLRNLADPVLLLDVDLPHSAWGDVVPEARKVQPTARVVLLVPSRSPRLEAQARSVGVSALVRRPFAIHELLDAVSPNGHSEKPVEPSPRSR
jgi:CheY-like chemotaxis protein